MSNKLKSRLILILFVLFGGGFLSSCCTFSGSGYQGPVMEYFDGEQFHNERPNDKNWLDVFGWWLNRDPGYWTEWQDLEQAVPVERIGTGDLRATFINHSTVLVQTDSVNILTDPVWSYRVTPVSFVGPKRHRPPGVKFEDLPKIDMVVISHNHYDHMDMPTLERLRDAHDPIILVPLGNKEFMNEQGFDNVVELRWWEEHQFNDFTTTFVPAEHFSNRGACDRNTSLWGGYVFHSEGGPVYFVGDTGFGSFFEKIRDEFGPMRFSMIPIGAYKPRWFMKPVHVNPEEAVLAHRILESAQSMGIHYGTFQQAEDSEYDPVVDLRDAMIKYGIAPGEFLPITNGKYLDIPPLQVDKEISQN